MEDRVVRGIPYIVHLSMLTVILGGTATMTMTIRLDFGPMVNKIMVNDHVFSDHNHFSANGHGH